MTASSDEGCVICLEETLYSPVNLPCGHRFCAPCFEQWRSKYDSTSQRTCPTCRSRIPPTKEMVSQLKTHQKMAKTVQDALETHPPASGKLLSLAKHPKLVSFLPKHLVPGINDAITDPVKHDSLLRGALNMALVGWQASVFQMQQVAGDGDELLEVPDVAAMGWGNQEPVEDLPSEIHQAACDNEVDTVLAWLGINKTHKDNPFQLVPPARINAKCSSFNGRTLLAEAAFSNAQCLVHILLQAGAYVDPVSDFGSTPLQQACSKARELEGVAHILLQWGADNTRLSTGGGTMVDLARSTGGCKLAALLEAPLGGRRCEIVNLPSWNGRTVMAMKYVPPPVDKYIVQVELTGEKFKARAEHLKRHDKTNKDPVGMIYLYHGTGSSGESIVLKSPCAGSENDKEYIIRYEERQRQQQDA